MESIKTARSIGVLLILGAVGVLIPYTMLTGIFQYPDILREDTSVVLTKFHFGGHLLIWTWFAFAIMGSPLIPAYVMIGQLLEKRSLMVRTATTIGVIGLIVQMVGLLRWTFVVPELAETFVNTPDPAAKAAAIVSFKMIHQFGGVILGEHLGQLFTIAWTVMMSVFFVKLKLFPVWINILGFTSAATYLMAQAELFETVMPGFPVWSPAGFIGSSLWLIWLIIIGVRFIKFNKTI